VVPRSSLENKRLKEVGANIRRVRTAKGITQEHLAESVELATRNLQKIEAGETNLLLTTFLRICLALECSGDELLPKR
jgi:transcriptional regulator with XRE-family HTH domain